MTVLPLDLFNQPKPIEEIEVEPQPQISSLESSKVPQEEESLEVSKDSNVLPLDLFDKAPNQEFVAEQRLEEKPDEETIPTGPEESFRQKAQGVKEIIANLGIGGLGYIAGGVKGFGVTGIQKLAEATGLLPEHLEMTTEERRKIRATEIERASTLGGLITPKTEFGKKGMEKIGEWLEPIQKFAESKADIFDKDKSPYLHDLTQFGIELFLFHLGGKAGSKAKKVVKLEEKIMSATGKVKKKLQGKLGKETDALIEMANKIAKEKPELLQKVKDYQDKMLERRVKNQQLISGAEGFSAIDMPKKRGLPGAEAFQAELKPLMDARKPIEQQREIQRKLERGVQPEKAPLEPLTYPEKPLQTGRPALTASELSKQIEQRRQKVKIPERPIGEEPVSDLKPPMESEVIPSGKVSLITDESLPVREYQISPETGKPEMTFTAEERKTYQIGPEGIKLVDKVPGEKSVWKIITDPLKNEKGFIKIPVSKIFKKKLSPERKELIRKAGRAAEQAGMKLNDFLIQGGMTKDQVRKFEKLYKMAKEEEPVKRKRKVVKETEDVLSSGLEVVKGSDNFKTYFDYLVKEKRLLSDTKVMDQAPDFVRPMIEKGDYPELITNKDLGLRQAGESPHGKFDWFYDLKDNPAYDAWESFMVSRMNIDYQKAWSDKLVKEIWDKKAQKDLNKTLKPYQNKLSEDIKSVGVLEKQIRKNNNKIREMFIGNNRKSLIERTEKMQQRLDGRIKKINTVMEEAITKHVDRLAKKHSSIRVMLASEGRLPEKIKLTDREGVIVKEIKKYFEKSKQEMIRNDIPVRAGDYTPNLFKAALGTEEGVSFFSKKKNVPSVLRFQHRGESTRSWYPDMKTMFDSYIPAVNRKVAYQPFLDRWREASAEMPPELSKYFDSWVDKELHYEQPGKIGKLTNFAVALEYFRTIGFAVRVAVKHAMKAPHTISEIGLRQTVKGIYRGPERLVESTLLKLNLKEQASPKARLLSSFYNAKQIVQLLEGSGLENAQSIFKTLPGSATTMIEFIENGINVLATIDAGMSKGIAPKIIQKKTWESLLDANHRPGLDDFPWRRNNPGWRSMTLFLNTPAKLLEHQKKLLRKTLTGKKDAYGTPYGKKLVYILASIGLAETIARSQDTSIVEMMLHIPTPHTMIETAKGIVHGIENPETKEFRKILPQISRIYKTTQGDYNSNYYSSPTRSLLGFSKLKKKNENKHKGIGTIGGIGSIGEL